MTAEGLELPRPADVWCQLSAVLDYVDLVAAGDAIISGDLIIGSGGLRTPPLATLEELRAAHRRHRFGTGTPRRLEALEALRDPVDSPQESRLHLWVISAGFPEPAVNVPVPTGSITLHVDLGFPDLKIALEYEGAHHFTNPAHVRHDLHRIELLHRHGWRVIRVTAEDLRSPASLLARLIEAFIEARGSATR